jgi:phytoene dehydrogenase-like protein
MSGTDVVVIGAGHNGLTAAALLARAGRRVCVVEAREVLGGLAAADEFHPGYRSGGLFPDTRGVRLGLLRALELEKHGLRPRASASSVLSLGDGGQGLLLHGDTDAAVTEIARVSRDDAKAYPRYLEALATVRPVVASFLDRPPLDLARPQRNPILELARRAVELRRLGRDAMIELLRMPPLTLSDWLGEWFESELLKVALALPAIRGCRIGPRSPGGTANLLLGGAAAGAGVEGDGTSLVEALASACERHGVEIRSGAPVTEILVDGGAVRGVRLDGGTELTAPVVAASCDPKRALLRLLPPGSLPGRVEERLRNFRTRGSTAFLRLALDRPPAFACRPDARVGHAVTGGDLVRLEQAHDAVKYRSYSTPPALEIHLPTLERPDLAPDGHAVADVLIHFAAYEQEPAWDDARRDALAGTVLSILETHAPGIERSVVARSLLAPPDLERRFGITGGQIHHGEHALDQWLVRPVPSCVHYATPLRGLYLAGSGSHPGGGLTCAPGAHAAAAILRAR